MTSHSDLEPSVRLSLPASPRFLSSARVVAASLGADAGFTIDDLDDLRLGINELVAALMEAADPTARIDLELVADGASVTVTGGIDGTAGEIVADELTKRILTAVVDHYELGPASFVLTKASSLREHI